MNLQTPIPLGWVFVAVVATFAIGLVLGWLCQQGLDRVLRRVAVRRAVREATAETSAAAPLERPVVAARTAATTAGQARPGMPFYRSTGGA